MHIENIKCSRCNHINPPYTHICTHCKNHLRERIVNVDLWQSVIKILEEPSVVFKNIIYSEHKNFISFIIFFIALKNLIIARYMSVPELGLNNVSTSFLLSFFLSIIVTILIISLTSVIQKVSIDKSMAEPRFIDVFSINTYSYIPYLIGLFFVFPIELVVLGQDIFSNNPYPFDIKPAITYILAGVEVLIILWTSILGYRSSVFLQISKIRSVFFVIISLIIWIGFLYLSSKFIFNI